MKRRDDYTKFIERFLERHRIETYRFEQRSKHRSVVIEFEGRTHTYIFPLSGSDWRGPVKAVSSLRHVLGLVGTRASS